MQLLKYLVVGLLNTLVGYGIFFILVHFLQVTPEIANAISYILALSLAFMLNKIYVFRDDVVISRAISKFLLAFTLAFSINQLVLIFFYRFLGFTAEISQLPAMLSYTLFFYVLNKHFVFSGSADK
jgi:putative flippase GtrA